MGNQTNYLKHSGMSTSFVTSFKRNLKLVEYFKSCWESEKIFKTLRNVHKLCNCIQKYSEACRLFTSMGNQKKYLKHSGGSTCFATSFKRILKLVEYFKSCGETEKIFRSPRRVHKLCNCIQKYSKACKLFISCGESEKIF